MYEAMKERIERAMESGKVCPEYITSRKDREALSKWTEKFTRHDHPTVIHILLASGQEKDASGCLMPSLVYLSRQKSRASPHHFKAGALNTLVIFYKISNFVFSISMEEGNDLRTFSH